MFPARFFFTFQFKTTVFPLPIRNARTGTAAGGLITPHSYAAKPCAASCRHAVMPGRANACLQGILNVGCWKKSGIKRKKQVLHAAAWTRLPVPAEKNDARKSKPPKQPNSERRYTLMTELSAPANGHGSYASASGSFSQRLSSVR